MRTIEWITGAALLLAVAGPGHAQAAHIWLADYDERDGTGVVYIHGTISDGDTRQYLSILSSLRQRNRHARIAMVSLDSHGGDEFEAEALALYGIGPDAPLTMVASGRTCASACMLLLMAGKARLVFAGARVGVHSVAEGGDGDTLRARGFTTDLARILADKGMAPDGRLVTTAPGSIYWLTADDLQRSGVKIGPDMRKLGPLPPPEVRN